MLSIFAPAGVGVLKHVVVEDFALVRTERQLPPAGTLSLDRGPFMTQLATSRL